MIHLFCGATFILAEHGYTNWIARYSLYDSSVLNSLALRSALSRQSKLVNSANLHAKDELYTKALHKCTSLLKATPLIAQISFEINYLQSKISLL